MMFPSSSNLMAKAAGASPPPAADRVASAAHPKSAHEDGQFDDCDDDFPVEMPAYRKGSQNNPGGTGGVGAPTPVPSRPAPGGISPPIKRETPEVPSIAESREEKDASDGDHPVNASGITKLDVLSGRGGGTNNHAGNRRFRHLCDQRRHVYVMSKKMRKRDIAREIVSEIRAAGGRFLKRNDATGEWEDIGEQRAVSKTSQALREGLAQKMRQALVESGTAERMARMAAAASASASGAPPADTEAWLSSAAYSDGRDGPYAGNAGMVPSPYAGPGPEYSPGRAISPDRHRKMPFSEDGAAKRQRTNFEP